MRKVLAEVRRPPDTVDKIMKAMEQQQQKAFAANQKRYKEILGGYGDLRGDMSAQGAGITGGYSNRYDTGMGLVSQMGESERSRIERDRNAGLGRADAAAAARGFYNSTVATGNQALVDREAGQQRLDLEDRLLGQRLSTHTGLSGDALGYQERLSGQLTGLGQNRLGFMERRTDEYPDNTATMLSLAQLAQAQATGGGGGGGAYTAGIGSASPAQFGYNIPGQSYGGGPAYAGYSYGGAAGGQTQGPVVGQAYGRDYSDRSTWTPQMKQQISWMTKQGYDPRQLDSYIKGQVRFDQLRPPA